MMRNLLLGVTLLVPLSANADDAVPFSNLDTEGYCTALVSKMLNAQEQQIEKDKCLKFETDLRAAMEPFWYLVEPTAAKDMLSKYMTEVRFETYGTVENVASSALGKALLDGRVSCSPGKATTAVEFSAINSQFYCYLKNSDAASVGHKACLEEEKVRKDQLAPYWSSIRKWAIDFCTENANSVHMPPFKILFNCLSREIGMQCFSGQRKCTSS